MAGQRTLKKTLLFSCPNLSAHFESNNWKVMRDGLRSDTSCTIDIDLGSKKNVGRKPNQNLPTNNTFSSSNYGDVKVLLTTGDITMDDSDVIVTSISSDFDLSKGPLSSALLRQAGSELQNECHENAIKKLPYMRISNSGNLSCKYVIHLVIPERAGILEKKWLETLTGRIITALQEAETLGVESVALPALGTGNIGMTPGKVAICMSEAIEAFAFGKARKIKTIKLVIFQSSMLASFWNNVLFTKEVINQERNMVTTKYGEINVTVCHGDISCDNSQVIVNGVVAVTSQGFNLAGGAVSSSLLRKAGSEMQRQCNNDPIMKSECMRITNRGNISCKYVIHLITPRSLDTYEDKIVSALKQAEELKATSVAIPALGTGAIGLPADKVAICMSEALKKFTSSRPGFVKTIKIYIFDSRFLPVFRSNVILRKEIMTCGRKQLWLAEAFSKSITAGNEIEVKLIGKSEAQLTKAKEMIQSHMELYVHKRVISDATIADLQDYDIIDVYMTASKHAVALTYSEMDHEFILYGVKANVDKLDSYLKQLFIQFKKAVDMSRNCEWKFDKLFQNFTNLPLRISYSIEQEYLKEADGKCSIFHYDSDMFIDFSNMKFTFCLISGKLERKDISAEDLPKDWSPMMGKIWLKVPLDAESEEYKRILQKFKASKPSFSKIFKIERVQNPILYKFYQLQKARMSKCVLSSNSTERELFHGTQDADSICAGGFDRGFAGKNATVYGKGTYFAVKSSYSVKYAKSDKQAKHMFLARVLTGNFCKGSNKMNVAPICDLINNRYDSTVDDEANPTLFAVFKDASAYPYYLISFV